jgi:hypothetical protein
MWSRSDRRAGTTDARQPRSGKIPISMTSCAKTAVSFWGTLPEAVSQASARG